MKKWLAEWGAVTVALLIIVMAASVRMAGADTLYVEGQATAPKCAVTFTGTAPTMPAANGITDGWLLGWSATCQTLSTTSDSLTLYLYVPVGSAVYALPFWLPSTTDCSGKCTIVGTSSGTVGTEPTCTGSSVNSGSFTVGFGHCDHIQVESGPLFPGYAYGSSSGAANNCSTAGEIAVASGSYTTGKCFQTPKVGPVSNNSGTSLTTGACDLVYRTGINDTTADGTSSYNFTFSWDGTPSPTVLVADMGNGADVVVHGKSFGDASQQITPTSSPQVVSITPPTGTNPSQVVFWCYQSTVGWVSWGDALGGGNIGAGASVPGCSVLQWYYPDNLGNESDGQPSQFTLVFNAGSGANSAEIVANPNDGGSGTVTHLGKSFQGDSAFKAVSNSNGDQVVIDVTTKAGSTNNPDFWCYNKVTAAWVDLGTVATEGTAGILSGGCFDLGKTFANSGMSLTDPVSWVTGLAKDAVGVGQWLVIPCSSNVHQFEAQFGLTSTPDSSSSVGVTQWLGGMGRTVLMMPASAVDTMKAAADGSGDCPIPGINLGALGHSEISANFCQGITAAGTASGTSTWWTHAMQIETALTVLFMVWCVYQAMARLLS